jgi:hypothetical protein
MNIIKLFLSALGLYLNLVISPYAEAGMLRYKPEYFDKILVEAELGTLKIGQGEGVIQTTPNPRWNNSGCELYAELEGHTLKVKLGRGDQEKRAEGANCGALIVIQVPSITDIEIKAGTADISIDEMNGKAKIRLKKGHLNIHSDLSELEVRGNEIALSSSGSIAQTNIEIDQNNLNLDLKQIAHSNLSKITLNVSALIAEAILPFQVKLRTRISGDNVQSRIQSDFPNSKDQDKPEMELRINSDLGIVGIRKIHELPLN